MSIKYFKNQNYDDIKSRCLNAGGLFEDDQFRASNKSLARFKPRESVAGWKRPHEIVDDPQFIVDRIVPNDIDQGQLGDCWFISAAANVAAIPEYIQYVVPHDQTFNSNDYAGIFRFRFWQFGDWYEVVIDDKLPVDENNQLVFCHNNKDTNEMFAPLLEKAFAKLNTCYEFIDGGDTVDAMIDMTGGVHERFKVKPDNNENIEGHDQVSKSNLWEIIFRAYSMKSLIGGSISVNGRTMEEELSNGLVLGHAYSILQVIELESSGGEVFDSFRTDLGTENNKNSVKLLKMRNPWGQKKSWKGNWSAQSRQWDSVDDNVKASLNFSDQTDGVFFISYDDFFKNFDDLDFVHVNMNAFFGSNADSDSSVKWLTQEFRGAWIEGQNAGGCGNGNFSDFWLNPQFCVNLELQNNQDSLVSLIVSLMQTEQARKRAQTDGTYENSNEPLNFSIYKVKNSKIKQSKYQPSELTEVYSNPTYVTQRETTTRKNLDPGVYVIIPSVFDKDVSMKFLLRVFIEGQAERELIASGVDLNKRRIVEPQNKIIKQRVEEEVPDQQIDEKTEEQSNDYEDQGQDEETYYYEQEEVVMDENEMVARNYQKAMNIVLDPSGAVVSRACSVM